jgi:hypothetical protein
LLALVLSGGRRNPHWAGETVKTVHLDERSLLITLFGEPDESIPSRDTCDRIEHDFSALAAKEGTNESRLPVVPKTEDWVAENGN